MRTTLLILSISASAGFVPKIPSPAKSPLRAETEAEAEAPPEPAAPAPAPAPAAFDPNKVFKVDESPLMAYISRSWNKLDGSDTVEVEEMLGAASDFTSRSPRRRLCDDVSLTQAQGRRDRRHDQPTRRARRQRPDARRVAERAQARDHQGAPEGRRGRQRQTRRGVVREGHERPVPRCVEIKILRCVLNHRVDLHAIDATPARWRGDAGSSPLDGASAATSSSRMARHTG